MNFSKHEEILHLSNIINYFIFFFKNSNFQGRIYWNLNNNRIINTKVFYRLVNKHINRLLLLIIIYYFDQLSQKKNKRNKMRVLEVLQPLYKNITMSYKCWNHIIRLIGIQTKIFPKKNKLHSSVNNPT